MAIKERKQITGTEAQIKGYAGHNGVLAYATDTKHLHVLSGTAGTTTKLANMSDIPAPVDISGKADKTYVDTELAKKQTKGDYATNTALTQGLAGKANSSHTHTKSQITDFPTIPDASNLIPRGGDGGTISVYETQRPLSSGGSIGLDSPSILVVNPGTSTSPVTIGINKGQDEKGATKLLYVFNASSITFKPITGVKLSWANATAPTFKVHNIVVLTFHNSNNVFASLVSAWDN